jgi:DNA-directed RNA polymerase delta subunit.
MRKVVQILINSINQRPQLSETDIAFKILQAEGSPQNYHDLIVKVLNRLNLPIDAEQISSVLTQINLDTRFAYAGQGEWGLKVWIPMHVAKKQPSNSLLDKTTAQEDKTDKDFSEEVNLDLEDLDSDLEDGILEIDDTFEREQEVQKYEDKWG